MDHGQKRHMQVVVAPQDLHWQSLASPSYDGALCGEVRVPEGSQPPMPLTERRIIAHRALLAIDARNAIINLGVGMPEVHQSALGPTLQLP